MATTAAEIGEFGTKTHDADMGYFGIKHLNKHAEDELVLHLMAAGMPSVKGSLNSVETAVHAVLEANGKRYGAVSLSEKSAVAFAYLALLKKTTGRDYDGLVERLIAREARRMQQDYLPI
jgi:hypothetical protein